MKIYARRYTNTTKDILNSLVGKDVYIPVKLNYEYKIERAYIRIISRSSSIIKFNKIPYFTKEDIEKEFLGSAYKIAILTALFIAHPYEIPISQITLLDDSLSEVYTRVELEELFGE